MESFLIAIVIIGMVAFLFIKANEKNLKPKKNKQPAVNEIQIDDYIGKLIKLEKRLGVKIDYIILEPLQINPRNVADIRNKAKRIANFLGLSYLKPKITINILEPGIAARVNLNYSREVHIELSRETLDYPNSILAILAHEITHKYLHINSVSSKKGKQDNEILTDISAVFLGLGKLLLNGCMSSYTETKYFSSSNEVAKSTRIFETGYLDIDQLAFVYLLISKMRKIPPKTYKKNLNEEALRVLREYEKEYNHYFKSHFHNQETKELLLKRLNLSTSNLKEKLANIGDDLNYIKNFFIEDTETFLNETDEVLNKLSSEAKRINDTYIYNPSLNFLSTIKLERQAEKSISDIKDYSKAILDYQEKLKEIKIIINQKKLKEDIESLKSIDISGELP